MKIGHKGKQGRRGCVEGSGGGERCVSGRGVCPVEVCGGVCPVEGRGDKEERES